jgi:23S rRNA (cytidine1920-2'-O)/16S rRNA (cytidine1409-2'-O)-methyltransferase
MAKSKQRADELLFEQGLASSRSEAEAVIMTGRVSTSDGRSVKKAGELLEKGTILTVREGKRYVSRGGDKLAGALEDLNLDPKGMNCLDLGASTGGFTDCLLQRGALGVTAVDVGKGLIRESLRKDPRVRVVEETNARHINLRGVKEKLMGPFDLVVLDLSFISLSLIIPLIPPLLKEERGFILAMVKPQFEAGREKVGKRGVVKNPEHIREAVDKIALLAPGLAPPFVTRGTAPSRLLGPKGNQEVFVLMERDLRERDLKAKDPAEEEK